MKKNDYLYIVNKKHKNTRRAMKAIEIIEKAMSEMDALRKNGSGVDKMVAQTAYWKLVKALNDSYQFCDTCENLDRMGLLKS